jgi:glutathione-specific gamma-glutamylcyclotransferase
MSPPQPTPSALEARPDFGAICAEPVAAGLVVRDPELAYAQLRAHWPGDQPCWVFGYASLIWRPEFAAVERRSALLHGWHRSLRMRSRVNRGSPQTPGLVFALLSGGACRGFVYRLRPDHVEHELRQLWLREMPTGVYDARVLQCHTRQGKVPALAFTLARNSPACLHRLTDPELFHILRHASGRYGSTLDYLVQTAIALRSEGVLDREVERQVALASQHGLLPAVQDGVQARQLTAVLPKQRP